MHVEHYPDLLLSGQQSHQPELFVYDLKMTQDVINSKVQLDLHMFSFLREGKKQVHFPNAAVDVSPEQSILIKSGNCIWSELLIDTDTYYCKLLFFSEAQLKALLKKLPPPHHPSAILESSPAFFIIENDDYLLSYLDSLATVDHAAPDLKERLISIKFEELMLYLLGKYGQAFETYLRSMVCRKTSSFQTIVEDNLDSNLNLEDIAFLCHMSLSTFKRQFTKVYGVSPGKWFRDQRLQKARDILISGEMTCSDIYQRFGYNNLSNFSAAFKQKFGKNPSEV